jgi:hypothetical protein
VRCIEASSITVGGEPCEERWVHFNGDNAISISMTFDDAPDLSPVYFCYDDCIRCFSMPSRTSIAFGAAARPRGLSPRDFCNLNDDTWVVMEFSPQTFPPIQV